MNVLKGVILFLVMSQGVCFAAAPREIGGLVLGANIEAFRDKLKMESDLPIRFREYLREVQLKDVPGFKSGVVWYTAFSEPHRIVRIKLKYAEAGRPFYDSLLKQFTKRFGKPNEWRGDCFDIFIAWKWSFPDSEQNRISMILQHNLKDLDKKTGNNIKLTMWNLIEAERLLFEQKQPQMQPTKEKGDSRPEGGMIDWEQLMPR